MEEAEFIAWASNVKRWRPKTLKDYLGHIRRAARSIELDGATTDRLAEFLHSTKPSAGLRNRIRTSLIAYYDFQRYCGTRRDNPARELERLPEARGLPRPLPFDKLRDLVNGCYAYSEMFGCLSVVYLNTGLRLSEVLSFQWAWFEGDWIFLKQKGGRDRMVFLSSCVTTALRRWKEFCSDPVWVFPSPRPELDQAIGGPWIERKMKEIAESVGIVEFTPHRYRHTFSTAFWHQTEDLLALMAAMGWTSIQTAVRYTETAPKKVPKTIEQLKLGVL